MAHFVMKDAVVTVDGVNLSDHVSEVSMETERDEVDVTAMGANNRVFVAGLGDATMTVTFFQDFAAAEVDATLWPLSTSNTAFVVSIKASSAATSATNPLFSMTALMYGYSPLSGGIGDASSTEVTFRNAAQAGLTRATA